MHALQSYCRKIEPTGVLRRGEHSSNAIDFICMTDDPGAVAERVLRHTFRIKLDELRLSTAMQTGLGINIWFARPPVADIFQPIPSNFETMQVIHTPTRFYLKDLVRYVRSTGYFLNREKGLVTADNRQVAYTEAGIYDALDLEMPPPSRMLDFRPKLIRNTAAF